MAFPRLSLVVLAWNHLPLTKACVESLRLNTDVTHELIIVDNGSDPLAEAWAYDHADVAVLNGENLGFAAGMNRGLEVATGDFVAFINNDTVFPAAWASAILDTFQRFPKAGIVLPAVTAAGNPITVRSEPGEEVTVLLPFAEFPSGVVYLLNRETMGELGGWNERYPVASSEDLDLCFTVWTNDLDIILDTRVLVSHVGQASVSELEDHHTLYQANLALFLERWGADGENDVVRLDVVAPEAHRANRATARTAIRWIERMLEARKEAARLQRALERTKATALETPKRPGILRRRGR